jgi:hypothetical protein
MERPDLRAGLVRLWHAYRRTSDTVDRLHSRAVVLACTALGLVAGFFDHSLWWLSATVAGILALVAGAIVLARRTAAGTGLQREIPTWLAMTIAFVFLIVLVVAIIAVVA